MAEKQPPSRKAAAGLPARTPEPKPAVRLIKRLLLDIAAFSQYGSGLTLRTYQLAAARAVVDSVLQQRGHSFVVMFPRQSGKNEVQAQIQAYLLTLLSQSDAELVQVSPTWKPQTLNAMRRLQRQLERNLLTRSRWRKESGYIFSLDRARIHFLSGSPTTHVVGATASTLLSCDEAQDILPEKWDKDFAPMAASTNATRIFWGTAWTSQTLLARELRTARLAEQQDGLPRVFVATAAEVAQEVPAYGAFVAGQVARFGREHPMVRTQFFSEEIDAQTGLFPERRLALLRGLHPWQNEAEPGGLYALLVDIGGEDAAAGQLAVDFDSSPDALQNPGRDATAASLVQIDLSTLADELLRLPTYRLVQRFQWTGVSHTRLYAQLKALAEAWQVGYLVIDATGIGAGLASFLERSLPGRVIPFLFTAKSKSELGWRFLSVIESGRYKEPAGGDDRFLQQARLCRSEVLPGPGKTLRWGVPDGTRDPHTAALVHDDLLVSAALVAELDQLDWVETSPPLLIPSKDPLEEMDRQY